MKKTAILACPSIEDEVRLCIRHTGCRYDLHILQDSNHNLPQKLHTTLQQAVDGLQEYDRILLTFGLCGNAALGLVSSKAELVLPKTDDCISLLMGSAARRYQSLGGKFGLFLTAGWLRYEEGLLGDIRRCLEKYGPQRGERIIARLYENLTYLTVLDTGAYDVQALLPRAQDLAERLDLQLRILPGDLSWLEALLTRPEDGALFLTVPAGAAVGQAALRVDFGN